MTEWLSRKAAVAELKASAMSAQYTDNKRNSFGIMCCSKCNHRLVFFMSDPENGLKGGWKCINPECSEVKHNES